MKVLVFPADLFGCGHYRLIYPGTVLEAQGHDVTVIPPGSDTGLSGMHENGRLSSVSLNVDADVVVLQRPVSEMLSQAVRLLRDQGITVVVDMDDDLSRIHPSNPAWSTLHPGMSPKANWEHAMLACRDASLVTVSTPALASRYGQWTPTALLPNLVPEAAFEQGRPDVPKAFGWAGAVHSHREDVKLVSSAVHQLVNAGNSFHVVGPGMDVPKSFGVRKFTATGALDLEGWYNRLPELSVGIAPLADSQFNAAKSWLKPLEYSAAGIPCVVSPRAEYIALADHIPGIRFATKPKEWVAQVRKLLQEDRLREELGKQNQEAARALTYERLSYRWLEAWNQAMLNDRKQSANHEPVRVS